MTRIEIREKLFSLQDEAYRTFQIKLFPTVPPETVIGVRTPALRSFAKELLKGGDVSAFLSDLPHRYFDENQLHAFLVSGIRDFDRCISEVCRFLPYVDNWATCDQFSPTIFKKRAEDLLPWISEWIDSDRTFTVRFAITMLMEHFLDERFDVRYLDAVAAVRSDEYYVNMAAAWYFATALAKHGREVVPYFTGDALSPEVRKKAIRKAIESYRITDEQKRFLRSLS